MKTEPTHREGFTLLELLVVIVIVVFLVVSLVVLARQFRIHSQIHGTRALVEKAANANEQFHRDWRFYAPDSPIPELGGMSWAVAAVPEIPNEVEGNEVNSDAPDMPGDRVPTTGNEYMMISLVLRGRYLRIPADWLAGPRRGVDLGTFGKDALGKATTRCIIVESWDQPFFYDCYKPEGRKYVNGTICHTVSAYDLFSLGRDGRTASAGTGPGEEGKYGIGEAPDDMSNWHGTRKQ